MLPPVIVVLEPPFTRSAGLREQGIRNAHRIGSRNEQSALIARCAHIGLVARRACGCDFRGALVLEVRAASARRSSGAALSVRGFSIRRTVRRFSLRRAALCLGAAFRRSACGSLVSAGSNAECHRCRKQQHTTVLLSPKNSLLEMNLFPAVSVMLRQQYTKAKYSVSSYRGTS